MGNSALRLVLPSGTMGMRTSYTNNIGIVYWMIPIYSCPKDLMMTKIIIEDPQILAQTKQRDPTSWDRLERTLIPSANKTLYQVLGFTGKHELGTYRFWLVRAFRSEEAAETYCTACSKHAQEWEAFRSSYTDSPPFGWSQLDPRMLMSYEGTYYRTYEIPIEMRPDEIISSADTCPICGAQVNATAYGYICDNGHSIGDSL